MPILWYITRFSGWELRLWRFFRAPEIDDTLANSVTIFRAKVSLYVGLGSYLIFALTREPFFLKWTIASMVLSGIIDLFDGTLAQWYGKSESGRCLDPAADFVNAQVAFIAILGEHEFEYSLLTESVVVVALGMAIFILRVLSGVETHILARAAIATMYLGGLAFFIEMVAASILLLDETSPWRVFGTGIGHCLFFLGSVTMGVSTVVYAWRAWPKIRFRPTGTGLTELT